MSNPYKSKIFKVKVVNVSTNTDYKTYPFVVVRLVNNEYWYYGAFATEVEAWNVAMEVGGMVVKN